MNEQNRGSGTSGEPGNIPWAQQSGAKADRATKRIRLMVTNLPDWEPLPPGELLVQRPRHGA